MSFHYELRDELVLEHVDLCAQVQHYHGAIMDVVVDDIRRGDFDMKREYIRHDDAVAVLLVREGDNGEEVFLIRQYRHPVQKIMWEIPAGLLDIDGESPEEAARRELYEEADMLGGDFIQLAQVYASPGCSTELYTVYVARGCELAAESFKRVDEEAEIEGVWFPFADVVEAVLRGDLCSPTLVVAVLSYRVRSW